MSLLSGDCPDSPITGPAPCNRSAKPWGRPAHTEITARGRGVSGRRGRSPPPSARTGTASPNGYRSIRRDLHARYAPPDPPPTCTRRHSRTPLHLLCDSPPVPTPSCNDAPVGIPSTPAPQPQPSSQTDPTRRRPHRNPARQVHYRRTAVRDCRAPACTGLCAVAGPEAYNLNPYSCKRVAKEVQIGVLTIGSLY